MWVSRSRVQVYDFQLVVEILVYYAVKLRPIVSYNRLRYPELANNILPHKVDNILIFDGGEGFSFYPFNEIVGDD